MEKLQAIDGGGDERGPGVPMAGDRPGDVDEVHCRAAEQVTERVGIVRQHDLHHFGHRLGWFLGGSLL